jgi:hypothetical protein
MVDLEILPIESVKGCRPLPFDAQEESCRTCSISCASICTITWWSFTRSISDDGPQRYRQSSATARSNHDINIHISLVLGPIRRRRIAILIQTVLSYNSSSGLMSPIASVHEASRTSPALKILGHGMLSARALCMSSACPSEMEPPDEGGDQHAKGSEEEEVVVEDAGVVGRWIVAWGGVGWVDLWKRGRCWRAGGILCM